MQEIATLKKKYIFEDALNISVIYYKHELALNMVVQKPFNSFFFLEF